LKKPEITNIRYLSIPTWIKPTQVSNPSLFSAFARKSSRTEPRIPQSHSAKLPPISLTNYTGFPLPPGYPGEGKPEFASQSLSSDQVFIAQSWQQEVF